MNSTMEFMLILFGILALWGLGIHFIDKYMEYLENKNNKKCKCKTKVDTIRKDWDNIVNNPSKNNSNGRVPERPKFKNPED